MATPSSSLGITTSFNATQFRNAVRFAMQMGAPPDATKRATFIFKPSGQRTYSRNGVPVSNPRLSSDGVPLDPEIKVIESQPVEVVVDCAIEIVSVDPQELPVGPYRPSRADVTVLDVDYAKITGCAQMRFNGDLYAFDNEQYGLGLFGVGVNVLHFYGINES